MSNFITKSELRIEAERLCDENEELRIENEKLQTENVKLRTLCLALYEFAYNEYPDSAELNFADCMDELGIEVN